MKTNPAPLHPPVDRQRRRVLRHTLAGVGSTALVASGLAACTGSGPEPLRLATLAEAEQELERLSAAKGLTSSATWNWAQTLTHCAQSIEYAMSGYPQARSALFQRTLGAAAFGVFSWRGRMSHDLAEPIPGAPALPSPGDAAAALARVRAAITAFRAWKGPLQPHFAYGALDHAAYERAHAMHLAEHLGQFRGQG